MADPASRWTKESFLIAGIAGPVMRRGWTYRGLSLHKLQEGSPKGRRKARRTVSHLNSGHRLISITADEELVFSIATELAEAGDWTFEGLYGWKNQFPDAPDVVATLTTRHRCVSHGGGGSYEGIAQQIAAARHA